MSLRHDSQKGLSNMCISAGRAAPSASHQRCQGTVPAVIGSLREGCAGCGAVAGSPGGMRSPLLAAVAQKATRPRAPHADATHGRLRRPGRSGCSQEQAVL